MYRTKFDYLPTRVTATAPDLPHDDQQLGTGPVLALIFEPLCSAGLCGAFMGNGGTDTDNIVYPENLQGSKCCSGDLLELSRCSLIFPSASF
jgi:hypothetical protein